MTARSSEQTRLLYSVCRSRHDAMTQDDFKALLASRRTEDRLRAAKQLAREGGPVELLLRALRDRNHYVAALAAEALTEHADEESAPTLVERFAHLSENGPKRDPGCHIRSNLAIALGRLDYGPAADILRVGICTVQLEAAYGGPVDNADHLRGNCALALAQIRGPDAVRDISLLLFGNTEEMLLPEEPVPQHSLQERKFAAQALAHCGNRQALVPLAAKLRYPDREDPDVLQECMQAVVDLQDPRALELLEPYLHHRDQHLAAFAALMVARTGVPQAADLIRDTIDRLSSDPLKAAVMALTVVRSEEGQAALSELAYHPREAVRLALVAALADARDEVGRALLRQLAESDSSTRVIQRARDAREEQ